MNAFTKRFILILCAATVGIAAVVVDSGALYFLSGFLLTLPLSARAFGLLSLRSVSLIARSPLPALAGDVMEVPIEVINRGSVPRFNISASAVLVPGLTGSLNQGGWRAEKVASDPVDGAGAVVMLLSEVPSALDWAGRDRAQIVSETVACVSPRARAPSSLRIQTQRRGVFPIGPFSVCHQDPLGLSMVRRQLSISHAITVYPRPLGAPLASLLGGDLRGSERTARNRGAVDGSDFYGIRPYRPGDEWRRIHWATTARVGSLMVVEREELASLSLVVALDLSAAAGPSNEAPLETLISLAAQLLDESVRRMSALDLVLMDAEGRLHIVLERCLNRDEGLEALARVDPSIDLENEGAPIESLPALVGHGPSLVVLTDRVDSRSEAVARTAAQAGWPGVVIWLDENTAPGDGTPEESPTRASDGGDTSRDSPGGPARLMIPIWRLHRISGASEQEGSRYHVEPLVRF